MDSGRCGSGRRCGEAIRRWGIVAVELGDDVGPVAHRAFFARWQSGERWMKALSTDGDSVHGATLACCDCARRSLGRAGRGVRGGRQVATDRGMSLCHSLFVNTRNGLLQESRARDCRRCPGGVASALGVRKSSCCWAAGCSHIKDRRWS